MSCRIEMFIHVHPCSSMFIPFESYTLRKSAWYPLSFDIITITITHTVLVSCYENMSRDIQPINSLGW